MLNPFPDLLLFSFFAPTILRVAAGVAIAYIGFAQWRRMEELSALKLPFGLRGTWAIWLSIAVAAGIAAGLIFGYYTQWAALLGALFALQGLVMAKRYPRLTPLCRGEYALLIVLCLSLLLSGAGALAFDLPL